MLKITYQVSGTFSLKKYDDGHLLARSYEYPTNSAIRGALLSSLIQRKGRKEASKLFYRLKETLIFVQFPEKYSKEQKVFNMISNKGMLGEKQVETIAQVNSVRTVGIREVVKTNEVVFYIDETLEDIVELLENISVLGNSESLVSLKSIKRVKKMKNVLVEIDCIDYQSNEKIYENMDWEFRRDKKGIDKGLCFEDIYAYSGKNKNKVRKMKCKVMTELIC